MCLREDILRVITAEKKAYKIWDECKRRREVLSGEYFSEKYGVKIGEIVYEKRSGKQIKLASFILWSDSVDDRPDITGSIKHPFGWDNRNKRYSCNEWETIGERDGEVNGNIAGNIALEETSGDSYDYCTAHYHRGHRNVEGNK